MPSCLGCGRSSKSLAEVTSYEDAVAFLDAHIGAGVKPGLDRISGLLDLLARPDEGYSIVHVAGTNGKTSTSRMIATLLDAHGLGTGLFTSPHLRAIEERYEVGMHPMTPDAFGSAVAEMVPFVDLFEERSGDVVTYFEITAALAFAWFAERAVDVAVIEAGLGGRWDATNAATSDVAVVTSIGREHTEYLGDTIPEITGEKVAILDPGALLVTGPLPEEARRVAEETVRHRSARWHGYGPDFSAVEARPAVGGWLFDVDCIYERYDELDLRLHGSHQVENFAVAVAAVESLFGRSLDLGAVREAAARVTVPGRMEVVERDPPVMLDGAHNPPGMEALAAALGEEFPTTEWALVFGVMRDKDAGAMLRALDGRVTSAHAVAARDTDRARPAREVGDVVADALDVPVAVHGSVDEAVGVAVAGGRPVLITGSLYVVGEARTALGL